MSSTKRVPRASRVQELGIEPRRHFVRTTDSKHDSPIIPNLYRNVIATQRILVWAADITYIRMASGSLPDSESGRPQPQEGGLRDIVQHRFNAGVDRLATRWVKPTASRWEQLSHDPESQCASEAHRDSAA